MHTLKITEHVPPMVQFICGISEGLSLIHITIGPFLLSQAWNPRKSKKKIVAESTKDLLILIFLVSKPLGSLVKETVSLKRSEDYVFFLGLGFSR